MNNIDIILGTMQFGERLFGDDVFELIKAFTAHGYTELDTAYVYNEGESERLIGESLRQIDCDVKIATKVNPRVSGRLDRNAVLYQFDKSLSRLNVDCVDVLYLHFPDPNTPVESALEACAELYDLGKFRELGLSNFPAWLVAEVYHLCSTHGWMLPTVYQGLYNALSRNAERELDVALNHYGLRFYAYNPLAGGLLTDKYLDKAIKDGRFTNRPNYKKRYWHESYFKAVDNIKEVCSESNIGLSEAAFRWLANHSMLKEERGDGIIIGASSCDQLVSNITAVTKGPLPYEVAKVIDESWEITKTDAPEYFSFYISPKPE